MAKNLPNLSGKTIFITGATDGIGKECALMLAKQGATVCFHGRNPKKIASTMDALKSCHPEGKFYAYQADFASLDDVRVMAEKVLAEQKQLDILINNAGMYPSTRVITKDGFEQTLQVNYISPFLLTQLLLPLLEATPSSHIINMSSVGHRYVWNHIKDPKYNPFFWRWVAYCRSKLLVIAWTIRQAKELEQKGVRMNCLHPGVIRTKVIDILPVSWGMPVESGAKTVLNLATNPNLQNISGAYFERFKQSKPASMALNRQLQENLWKASFEWAGLVIES